MCQDSECVLKRMEYDPLFHLLYFNMTKRSAVHSLQATLSLMYLYIVYIYITLLWASVTHMHIFAERSQFNSILKHV